MNVTKIKPMNPRSPDTKYTGFEPEWRSQPTDTNRVSRLTAAFSWYNYHYGKKDAKELVIDWLSRNDRTREAKEFARVPDSAVVNTTAWLCRMNVMGLELTESERSHVDTAVRQQIEASRHVKEVVKAAEDVVAKPNIQDRLREKMSEAVGELEGMYDDMILAGGKMSADYKPITILRGLNVAPQMVGDISAVWQRRLTELEDVLAGKDAQLVEGYSNFGKIQIKSLVKFCEAVIADCGSYVQIKKVERKPRKKKPVSPEKLTARFKYQREFPELKLKSVPVTSLVEFQEAWMYDTKKRKLIYVVADSHIGTITVKGTGLVGFDASASVQKTLRKPAEQIKALLTGGVAQHRKYFKDIKATEIKFNGRGSDNLILLKVR
jgi:hypothetical protein